MFGIIGTIDSGAVIQGGGFRHAMIADENGVVRDGEAVVWDNADATPEFEVIGYAADRQQAVEVAHSFADSCGLVFVDIPATRAR
jgi:ATP-dependent DNA ligase